MHKGGKKESTEGGRGYHAVDELGAAVRITDDLRVCAECHKLLDPLGDVVDVFVYQQVRLPVRRPPLKRLERIQQPDAEFVLVLQGLGLLLLLLQLLPLAYLLLILQLLLMALLCCRKFLSLPLRLLLMPPPLLLLLLLLVKLGTDEEGRVSGASGQLCCSGGGMRGPRRERPAGLRDRRRGIGGDGTADLPLEGLGSLMKHSCFLQDLGVGVLVAQRLDEPQLKGRQGHVDVVAGPGTRRWLLLGEGRACVWGGGGGVHGK